VAGCRCTRARNHAVFLTYLEEGRDAFCLQALGRDPHYAVARVEIDWRAEVRCTGRQLRVRIEVERVGTASLTAREAILTSAGVTAAEARVVSVLWRRNRFPVPPRPCGGAILKAVGHSGQRVRDLRTAAASM
jgi:acyl-CoA thioesterase FadM